MKIALAQINPIIGDLDGNTLKILAFAQSAAQKGAELVVFPELCLTGYPPMDLLDIPHFIQRCQEKIQEIADQIPQNVGVLLGAPVPNPEKKGKRLLNAALLLENGEIIAQTYKRLLPTYDVFDEYRYFEPADSCAPISYNGLKLGVHICEDMWNNEDEATYHLYDDNPIDELGKQGVDVFINLSGSPYHTKQQGSRLRLVRDNVMEYNVPFLYVNQVGANTELIFDGSSFVVDAKGNAVLHLAAFEEDLQIWDSEVAYPSIEMPFGDNVKDMHDALVLGIRDYFEKTGAFDKVLIGLSGGIDSALTCALAVEALGADKVVGITMPSKYSSSGSVSDSEELAQNTGIAFHNIPIPPAVSAFGEMLAPIFEGTKEGIAEENIQARTRGVTLMAVSNKFNYLLLTTGNKSEMAVGYCTLYGDMNGGLSVLADVFKMEVYRLSTYINERAGKIIIPQNTIDKAPSAELKPGQRDQDSLPPYPVLDEILRLYIEERYELDQIVQKTTFDRDMVASMLRKVDLNEYKRKQAAPGLRVTAKAFGTGRRLPIVMRYKR